MPAGLFADRESAGSDGLPDPPKATIRSPRGPESSSDFDSCGQILAQNVDLAGFCAITQSGGAAPGLTSPVSSDVLLPSSIG